MKHPFRSNMLPAFPLLAGVLGLLLRFWLFSTIDEKGLLPATHFADTALYLLTAITLGIVFLASKNLSPRPLSAGALSLTGILGCALGGLGLLCTSLQYYSSGAMRFSTIAALSCAIGGFALLAMAVLKVFRKQAPYGCTAILTVCLILNTIATCQTWGMASQLQEYFFPLMAAVFLILSAYHATRLDAGQGAPELMIFFSQCAVFFCCICLNTAHWPMYLGMLFWAISQLYPHILKRKEA